MISIFIKIIFTLLFWSGAVLSMQEYNQELKRKSKLRYLSILAIWLFMFGIYVIWSM